MSEEDKEKYLALLKKVLSGAADKNRLDLAFRTAQVADSDEHRLLMKLRDSELQDEEAQAQLFQTIIGAVHFEENYLILLAHENTTMPFKAKDGAMLDDSDHVYSYFVCAICPVKAGKETLSYETEDKAFHIRTPGYAAAMPELGFLFPAFDGRQTNLYNCLYYTRSAGDNHRNSLKRCSTSRRPCPQTSRRGSFDALLSQTLGEVQHGGRAGGADRSARAHRGPLGDESRTSRWSSPGRRCARCWKTRASLRRSSRDFR